jgi:arsenate reductase-like glutaredoxin family protein
MMKHTELVDKYDAQVDALEEQFRSRGLAEEQTEPFFFQLRTQTFFFARLDDLSVDATVQDELYAHYIERQTTIERWIEDITYALKYGYILEEAGLEATEDPHEIAYLKATMNDEDVATIHSNLAEALNQLMQSTDNEVLAGKLERFRERMLTTNDTTREAIMPVLKRVEKLIEKEEE